MSDQPKTLEVKVTVDDVLKRLDGDEWLRMLLVRAVQSRISQSACAEAADLLEDGFCLEMLYDDAGMSGIVVRGTG